jgi:regulator of sigma E protease
MSVVIIIVLFIVALFVAVCLHELGHFIAAKRAGVKVEEFGIGIPPRLFGIKRGETIYSVNAIPIGAFVKAAGENDPTVPRSLAGKGPWTRLGIYAAGPLVNIFLAFVLLSTFLALPVSFITGNGLMVHSVAVNSSAEEAGIEPGDIILEVDGQPVHTRGDMQDILNSVAEGTEITLLLQRNGQETQTRLKPKFDPELQRRIIGVLLCWNMVTQTEEGSPAYEAGIRADDTIVSINEQAVYSDESMSKVLRSVAEGERIDVVLLRGGNVTAASLINVDYETLPGAELQWVDGTHIEQERLPVWRAVSSGARYIVYMPVLIIEAIPLMIESPDLALVGPIGAGQLTVEVVRSSGFSNILFMAAIISLGLGIFNLFPIPPLDGGGMLVALIEGFRHGKRLSTRTVRLAHYVGTALLIAVMVLVTFSDVYRLISGKGFGL